MDKVYIVIETYCTQGTTVNATPCTDADVAEQVMERIIESYKGDSHFGNILEDCVESGCTEEGWWRIEDPFSGYYAEVELCEGEKNIVTADNIKDFKP